MLAHVGPQCQGFLYHPSVYLRSVEQMQPVGVPDSYADVRGVEAALGGKYGYDVATMDGAPYALSGLPSRHGH